MKSAKLIDPIDGDIAELEAIHQHVMATDKRLARQVKADLLKLKAGHSAEKNAAHLLDKHHADSKKAIVLHDLRFEVDGDVAQIDHLRINRFGYVCLYETKSFNTGLKIDEDGTFWRWDNYQKQHVEIPSPLLQSKRHETTVRKVLNMINYNALEFVHFVLVDYKASLDKPKRKEFDLVCRPDRLKEAEDKYLNTFRAKDLLAVTKGLGRLLSSDGIYSEEDLKRFGRKLTKLHKPLKRDHWARYGLTRPDSVDPTPALLASDQTEDSVNPADNSEELLSSHKVAKQFGMTTQEFLERAEAAGLVEKNNEVYVATNQSLQLGAENRVFRKKPYVAWPVSLINRLRPK